MKIRINNLQLWLALLLLPVIHACKRADFQENNLPPVQVYFNQPGNKLEIPLAGTFTKDDENVTVPIEVSLSGATPNAFRVYLNTNTSTITNMIYSGDLPASTFIIPTNAISIPPLVEFSFGTQKANFNMTIPRRLIELNYGKTLAIGIQMSNPNKGNAIFKSKNTVVVMLNTLDIINQQDVHYISFTQGGASPLIINPSNSIKAGSLINIPLSVDLSGTVGTAFSVNIASNIDTINTLISNATLLNTMPIPSTNYTVPGAVNIDLKKNSASFTVQLNISDLLKNLDKKQAFALTLNNPGKYQVAANKKTIVVVIDPLTILNDLTGLLQNTAPPFAYATLEPLSKRWGKLAGWISNDVANNYKSQLQYGSFDANNGTNISFEAWSPDKPAITNGKIYQTITLPAGVYTFSVNLRGGSNAANQKAYMAVIDGSTMPDVIPLILAGNSLGFKQFTNTTGIYSVSFTLLQTKQVTIGFCATITPNNSYNINSVQLTRQLN